MAIRRYTVTTATAAAAASKPDSDTQGQQRLTRHTNLRYDTRCCFNVRSKADMSQLDLPHGTDN